MIVPVSRIAGLLLPALLLIFSSPTRAFAQEARKHSFADTATVVGVDTAAGRLTLRDDESGSERTIATDATTRVRIGADDVPLARVQAGDRVTVSARREGAKPSEVPIADIVQVVIDPSAASDAPAANAGPKSR